MKTLVRDLDTQVAVVLSDRQRNIRETRSIPVNQNVCTIVIDMFVSYVRNNNPDVQTGNLVYSVFDPYEIGRADAGIIEDAFANHGIKRSKGLIYLAGKPLPAEVERELMSRQKPKINLYGGNEAHIPQLN